MSEMSDEAVPVAVATLCRDSSPEARASTRPQDADPYRYGLAACLLLVRV
jgi:hypothetical protein